MAMIFFTNHIVRSMQSSLWTYSLSHNRHFRRMVTCEFSSVFGNFVITLIYLTEFISSASYCFFSF